jgi:hypothetical protein
MKKSNIPEINNDDPIDGVKMIGCLFVGIVILAVIISIASYFIHQLR